MQLPETSALTKANAIISVIATIVYIIAFACPYWLVKEFVLEALPPIVYLDVDVDSNIGLFIACKVVSSFLGVEEDSCTSDGAADWQNLCAVLAITALIFTVASCLLSVLNVVVEKLAKAHLFKILTACLSFIAAGLMIAVVVIFKENKVIQVYPPHPQQEDFNFGWSYLLTFGSASAFVLLMITTIVDVISAKVFTGSR